MLAQKAIRSRTVYGCAALVCAALATWVAVSPPAMFGVIRALKQTGHDSELPLERFFLDAAPMASLQAQQDFEPSTSTQSPQPAGQTMQPSDWHHARPVPPNPSNAGQDHHLVRLGMPTTELSTHFYYRKVRDWKNWT